MKFSLVAAFALIASVMAQSNNVTVIPNSVGGTAASASITVNNPNTQSAGIKLNSGVMAIALTSAATAATAAYALI